MSQSRPTDIEATRYAENYVLYGDQSRAFRAAFPDTKAKPESIHEKASKLHSTDKVRSRIEELHESINSKADESALFTAEQALAELDENRQLAIDSNQISATNAATMGKAKIAGLLIDKIEQETEHNFAKGVSVNIVGK